ncbi:MAG: hypothetical protein E3J90_12610 [Promethearchaeota archaeon]|nr:MAG: hypothetical protein E3J90_12610 [Candidatus Lokiarchaeota archaeon]
MKLWIIYKEEIGFLKIIAERLQDRLEDYIDVSVGTAKKIDPSLLLEEKLDYLIIGDFISETIPSLEIQNWVVKYIEISKINNLSLKALSGFYITLTDIKNNNLWVEFLQDNVNAEIIYPPILRLKLNRAELAFENGVHEIVKVYSNEFIEFIINNKKNNKRSL